MNGTDETGNEEKRAMLLDKIASHIAGCDHTNSQEMLLLSVQGIRKLLSTEGEFPPIDLVIQAGGIPKLAALLCHDCEEVVFEASWALSNLASGTSQDTQVLVDNNVVPLMVRLMHHPAEKIREQAVWGLGNIAGDCAAFRDIALKHGMMAPLLGILTSSEKLSTLRTATWALSNLCRGEPKPSVELLCPAIAPLVTLLCMNDVEVVIDACSALGSIAQCADGIRSDLVDARRVCTRLVELLSHRLHSVDVATLGCIKSVVSGDVSFIGVFLNAGLPQGLYNLLSKSSDHKILKLTCTIIADIVNQEHLEITIGSIEKMAESCCGESKAVEVDVRMEVSDLQISGLQCQKCIRCCAFGHSLEEDSCLFVLLCLEKLLESGKKETTNPYVDEIMKSGAVRWLRETALKPHSRDLGDKAAVLLEFFPESEDEGEAHAHPEQERSETGEVGDAAINEPFIPGEAD
eukprot:TRINITY_DN347_c0_g1_i2.p1 TRINITY_DN347_c0_g1~~TRINITY_DN347_c0_g1_i2.p1  ORF type:complete len:471 (+),score=86.86 TRINITY_DN347_c0_g1_i2:29-1414(+)